MSAGRIGIVTSVLSDNRNRSVLLTFNTTLKKLFDDFPTCFRQNFEKFAGLLWIKSEQVLEELWSYVISKELK